MSSYHGEVGAWNGGPPGAEADYVPHQAPPQAAPLPTTDPWTGVSYSQYGQPQYDYPTYNASGYGYTYDSTYYQGPEGGYYNSSRAVYPPQQDSYDYNQVRDNMRHRPASRDYNRQRLPYKSNSRSPYNREREYSIKRESSYNSRRRRSRSRSAYKSEHSKYSSSERSSRSRSYSKSPSKRGKNRRSKSSHSSRSDRSYNKNAARKSDNSMTPPLKGKASQNRSSGKEKVKSRSPSCEKSKSKVKTVSSKQSKFKDRRERDKCTPPRKGSDSPKSQKKPDRSSFTPPTTYNRSEQSSQKKIKHKKSRTPPKKPRDSSITPPRSYARSRTSSSRSRSKSGTPKIKRNRSETPKSTRSMSTSSSNSSESSRSHSKRRLRRKSSSRGRSHSNSRSTDRSGRDRRSRSRRRSGSRSRRRSRTPKVSKSRSRSHSSRSRSHSRTPSEEECRGQFTVADRKRFWKLHRNRQEKAEKSKTPPKDVKPPPPGAIDSTAGDDIIYGDPPEVEGPNYADLLPPLNQAMVAPSTSKFKPVPIPIKNDGSFLEMFKKMQEQTKIVEETAKKPEIKKPVLPFIGKRRGGRVLKTGLVKKAKAIDEQTVDNAPKDAWSLYMQEVKKYRETSCEEERKTRPLVK